MRILERLPSGGESGLPADDVGVVDVEVVVADDAPRARVVDLHVAFGPRFAAHQSNVALLVRSPRPEASNVLYDVFPSSAPVDEQMLRNPGVAHRNENSQKQL